MKEFRNRSDLFELLQNFVMQAYGFSIRDTTETSCVAAMMRMYRELTE